MGEEKLNCPQCSAKIESVSGYAKAEVTILALVEFQILPKDAAKTHESLSEPDPLGRKVADFRYGGQQDVYDSDLSHKNLEWDDSETEFFCDECQFNLPRELVEAWLIETAEGVKQ